MKFKITTLLLLFSCMLTAQSWELGIAGGASNYQGDLVETNVFTLKEFNPHAGLFLRRNFNKTLGLRIGGTYGVFSGDDQNFEGREDRGYKFKSNALEFSGILEVNTLSELKADGSRRKVRPYFFGGVGYSLLSIDEINFNETASINVPKAQAIAKDKADLEDNTIVFPLGAGFKFAIGQKATLSLETGVRPTLTDYVDGVSQAGNPDRNDWYIFGGINLAFKLGKGKAPDKDGDGIADKDDKCPDVPGVADNMGCPADSDKDGVYDRDDKCPALAGVAANMGCPADRDKDGIYDTEDKCPDVAGVAANMGCPADRDKDGIYDKDDKCPDLAGVAANMGCPSDRDKDGVYDTEDECPDLAGIAANKGCPSDRDKDGVYDKEDKCPDLAGDKANSGCPAMKAEDKKVLDLAVKNVNFESGKAVLTKDSYKVLDQVADILKRYDYYNVSIDGHTDSAGNDDANMTLSKNRAKACYEYLMTKGVSALRMSHQGFGETKPVASNTTTEGKRQNRRVEFNLNIK